jgi:hypothetical protein
MRRFTGGCILNLTPNDKPRPWFDAITWVLIFGGLLSLVFSFALGEGDGEIAAWLATGGGLATAIGALMVYIRSRS